MSGDDTAANDTALGILPGTNGTPLPFVVIVTALKVETQAILPHIDALPHETDPHGTVYERGIFRNTGQSWQVAVAEAGPGNHLASDQVHFALNRYNPDVLLFVGVAGGLKDDIRLGDVIASTKVYCYHSGKSAEEFRARPEMALASRALTQKARWVARHPDWLSRIKEPCFDSAAPPDACVAPIASGEQVVSSTSSVTFARLRDSYNDAVAVEMEGYGALRVAAGYGRPAMVIRGISDKIDGKQAADAKGWQKIASSHASAFAFELLASYPIALPPAAQPPGAVALSPDDSASASGTDTGRPILDEDSIKNSFSCASRDLLAWPTTLDGTHVLPTPALNELWGTISTQSRSATVILGEPGAGKSALLAMVGAKFAATGCPLLAIKADRLDTDIDTPHKLTRFLGLPDEIGSCVQRLAVSQPVLVLIDQLDALADLVDLKSQRLNVLLNAIEGLSGMDNVHVVTSCRVFEYHHDIRLTTIDANQLLLDVPPWSAVAPILAEKNLDAAGWPERFTDMLRTPQHLKTFLKLVSAGGNETKVFESYQAMLGSLWQVRVTNPNGPENRDALLTMLATRMASEETLWLATSILDQKEVHAAEYLEAEGILVRSGDNLRIGFRHQTLFDFAWARAFARQHSDLSQYVINRQDALFVRPKLWSSLIFLRASAPATYKREFGALWTNERVRLHIRYLLIEFLGQLDDPDEQEAKWLLDCIDGEQLRDKALVSLAGKKTWFEIVSASYLPLLMTKGSSSKSGISAVLSRAWLFARDAILQLIRANWLPDASNDVAILNVMSDLPQWDEGSVDIVCKIVGRTDINGHFFIHLATIVSGNAPDLAPKLVRAYFDRALTNALKEKKDTLTPVSQGDGLVEQVEQQLHDDYRNPVRYLLEKRDLYELPSIAEAAPRAFLDAIWPWFLGVLDLTCAEENAVVAGYRWSSGLATHLSSEDRAGREYPTILAIEQGILELARQFPEEFVAFSRKCESADYLVVQRLLARGLTEIAATHPEECLRFLTADRRRLSLGELFEGRIADSISLISACTPHLSDDNIAELEQAVFNFTAYQDDINDDASTRFQRKKWDREKRLILLKAFPVDRLSEKTRALIDQEERALPSYDRSAVITSGAHAVVSPMSCEQMAKAKDHDILGLLQELDDKTEWDHPRRNKFEAYVGGSIQASRAFAEFAQRNPGRAIEVIRHLKPGSNERPAGYAIQAMAKSDLPSSLLFDLVKELAAKGFGSREYRVSVADAMGTQAKEPEGLPEDICQLLQQWLAEIEPASASNEDNIDKESDHSILWNDGGLAVLPQGSYTILEALMKAYLLSRPPRSDKWLDVLEVHLTRPESVRTWQSLAMWQLKNLRYCTDKDRAKKFVVSILAKYPDVRDCSCGAFLVANLHWWIGDEILLNIIKAMRDSSWVHGHQAYAEILFLHAAVTPEAQWAHDELDDLLNEVNQKANLSGLRLGLCHAAANLWNEPGCRELATETIVHLVPGLDESGANAIMDLFRRTDSLTPDHMTHHLLRALCEHPHVMQLAPSSYLLDRVQDLLPAKPEWVADVCEVFLETLGEKLADVSSSLFSTSGDLVNIALTLQRYEGALRTRGLELFERLLALNVYGARDALIELDGVPPVKISRPIARRRRRRLGKKTKRVAGDTQQ